MHSELIFLVPDYIPTQPDGNEGGPEDTGMIETVML